MFIQKDENNKTKLNPYHDRIFSKQNHYYNNLFKLEKVVMGSCYSKSDNNVTNKAPNIWKSFDEDTYNFHIVPAEREYSGDARKKIRESLIKTKEFKKVKAGYGRMPWTKSHWWIECRKGDYVYLLLFQTLIFENAELNCYLDKIQFCRYPIKVKGPNMDENGDFRCMYPERLENGQTVENGVFKCTELKLNEESVESIVSEFMKFVNIQK